LVLGSLRERLLKAYRRGFVSDQDFAKLEPYLPPAGLQPWSELDLPAQLQRPFRDRGGSVGRLVLIEPTAGQSDSDVKYLMRWADSFREVRLSDGALVRGSGRAVIFADILQTVLQDIPRTVLASLGMTLLVVLLTCRSRARAALVLGALAIGLGGVALLMNALRIKINFFNFVALPVSFGIAADYAVNYVVRYEEEPARGALPALRSTGGAILLCSLTTTLGYLALLFSVNQAIRSLGLLAVLGEASCLAAATLALPAYLVWRERAESRRLSHPDMAGDPAHAAAVVAGDEPQA
jgi:predicted RND superfamily exporter protein